MRPRTPVDLPPFPDLSFEKKYWQEGWLRVAGLDEAGRGALAGPVAVGAVILPADESIVVRLSGVRDSKQMTPRQRTHWAEIIRTEALTCAVGMADAREIDRLGLTAAIQLAAGRALEKLVLPPEALLADYGLKPDTGLPLEMLVKGDRRSLSIAAASVLAKTTRDALLVQLDADYPGYGLAQHKGYATRAHRRALGILGPSAVHRRSFTVREFPD